MVKMLSPAFPPRRASGLIRYAVAAVFLISVFYYLNHYTADVPSSYLKNEASDHGSHTSEGGKQRPVNGGASSHGAKTSHPIDYLIQTAQDTFDELIAQESNSVEAAAAAYRKRRGRHPPPGFKEWYEFAKERNAVIVEDFFDQVYHDLNPFWGLQPEVIRKEAADFEMTINVRGGRASAKSDWFWTQIWLDMIRTIEHLLPDMDIALNAMDEPRLVVPWEDIAGYMEQADKTRHMARPKDVVQQFQELPSPEDVDPSVKSRQKNFEKTSRFP
jgi:hypothetical protein